MKKYFLVGLIAFVFASCQKTYVSNLSFDVSTSATTYKVGDTISFLFSGNADNVAFYPGTPGLVYENRFRDSALGTPVLNFFSLKEFNTVDTSLFLLASTDYNGAYDSASVLSATWTDISNRAKFSKGLKDTTPSGAIDLSDFAALQKPLFLAFKYVGMQNATVLQSRWTINRLTLTNNLGDSTKQSIATQADATFVGINIKNTANRWAFTTAQLQIRGGTALNALENEDWAISRPLKLSRSIPDVGLILKSISSGTNSYKFPNPTFSGYTMPGKYKATFVATNRTAFKDETIVKEIEITIVP